MVTKADIKKLRNYLNSKDSLYTPSDITKIIDELCMIYEMKYGL